MWTVNQLRNKKIINLRQKDFLLLINTEAGRYLLGIKDLKTPIVRVFDNGWLFNDGGKQFEAQFFVNEEVIEKLLPFIDYEDKLNEFYSSYLQRHLGFNEKIKRFEAYNNLYGHLQLEIPQIYNADYNAGAGDGDLNSDSDTQGTPISQAAWDTIHDASECISGGSDHTNVQMSAAAGVVDTWLRCRRVAIPIDTSGIDDAATITLASLYFYPTVITDTHTDSYRYVRIVQTTTASTSTLVTEDYDQIGAINNPTAGAADTNLSSLATGSYQHIDLNSTGRGWISKTGYTKLGIRMGHDVADIYVGSGNDTLQVYSSNNATNKPYLKVTLLSASAIFFGANF